MPDYKVDLLNGLLTQAGSCREFMEVVAPLAERILADCQEVTPRLFFVTQDGEDGLLTFEKTAVKRALWALSPVLAPVNDFRCFCAMHGVKACAFLYAFNWKPSQDDDKDSKGPIAKQGGSSGIASHHEEGDCSSAGDLLSRIDKLVLLQGEFLGETRRVCGWNVDPSAGPARIETAWNAERNYDSLDNLLSQGNELGYPIHDELRNGMVAHLCADLARHGNPSTILSVAKGKTAGEIAFETNEGPARIRIVEKNGFLFFIELCSGTLERQAKTSWLLAELERNRGEAANAKEAGGEEPSVERAISDDLCDARRPIELNDSPVVHILTLALRTDREANLAKPSKIDEENLEYACYTVRKEIDAVLRRGVSSQEKAHRLVASYLSFALPESVSRYIPQDEVIRALARASQNGSDKAVRDSALRALQQIAYEHLLTIAELVACLSMDAEARARLSADYLWEGGLDWSAHEALVKTLTTDPDKTARAMAAEHLGSGDLPWIVPSVLIRALMNDQEIAVRCAAAKALGTFYARFVRKLRRSSIEALKADQNGRVHRKALAALKRIGYCEPAAARRVKEAIKKDHNIRNEPRTDDPLN